MNRKPYISSAILGASAVVYIAGCLLVASSVFPSFAFNPFLLSDDEVLKTLTTQEFELFLGLMVILFSSMVSIATLEPTLKVSRRSNLWALSGLLAPAAVLLAIFMKPLPKEEEEQKEDGAAPLKPANATINGMMSYSCALLITLFFLCALWFCITNATLSQNQDPPDVLRSNCEAFNSLQRIISAQQKYIERDRDGDGQKSYALFVVHLWQSVHHHDGSPLSVSLIPRRLAFSRVPAFACEGYVFKSLYYRNLGKDYKRLDYHNEWAVVAFPVTVSESSAYHPLVLIASSDGNIHARRRDAGIPDGFPVNPAADGWKRIVDLSEIKLLSAGN